MKLLIISHTEHFRRADGQVAGWGPTVREINYLTNFFEEIYHVAPLHSGEAPPSCLVYESTRIHFVPVNPSGGHTLSAKVGILSHAPATIRTVMKTLKKVDVFQFRAPTGIGVYLLPWLTAFCRKLGWVKYAGNWAQEKPPVGYAFQRWWLTRNFMKCPVTINGKWRSQPEHCLTFENPCLDENERSDGARILENKSYEGPLNFCFVGRLDEAKGVGRILEGFRALGNHPRIGTLHFVGDGPGRVDYEARAASLGLNVKFHGFLERKAVSHIYELSHVILLLSKSEGFPKVVAEAANYGCIPLVSNVGSLSQYVRNGENGFCIDEVDCDAAGVASALRDLFALDSPKFLAREAHAMAASFTFTHYNNRIQGEVGRWLKTK